MTMAIDKSLMDMAPSELASMIDDLPALPSDYRQLLRAMQDPELDVPQFVEEISRDPSLADKILSVVDVAFNDTGRPIRTLSQAVVILGYRALRSAALALAVLEYFQAGKPSSEAGDLRFWTHAMATGCICKTLAADLGINQQEEAFLVGLLHDTGKLIIKGFFPDDYDMVCEAASEQEFSWLECEQALFPVTHAYINRTLLRHWDFPPTVADAIGCHHDPSAAGHTLQLAALLNVADYLAYRFDKGAPGAYPPKECHPDTCKILGIERPETRLELDRVEADLTQALTLLETLDNRR